MDLTSVVSLLRCTLGISELVDLRFPNIDKNFSFYSSFLQADWFFIIFLYSFGKFFFRYLPKFLSYDSFLTESEIL
jgi:hypothetical protein